MYYRRRLPHVLPDLADGTYLFVTWRLAGSLQKFHPGVWSPKVTPGNIFVSQDREMDKAAYGPTWLKDAKIARVVAEALIQGESEWLLYELRAWVIMPNHVHAIIRPQAPLSKIMRWLKGSTAKQANKILNRTGEPFWQGESFDHRVRDLFGLERVVRYVEYNPVAAGLVSRAELWPWSSAGLAGGNACPTKLSP